jgi:hypothetical protein
MSALQKRILGSVLSAAFMAGVHFLAPAYQEAAIAAFAGILGALHIPRPGDVKAAE